MSHLACHRYSRCFTFINSSLAFEIPLARLSKVGRVSRKVRSSTGNFYTVILGVPSSQDRQANCTAPKAREKVRIIKYKVEVFSKPWFFWSFAHFASASPIIEWKRYEPRLRLHIPTVTQFYRWSLSGLGWHGMVLVSTLFQSTGSTNPFGGSAAGCIFSGFPPGTFSCPSWCFS